jgi:hypothetical protein
MNADEKQDTYLRSSAFIGGPKCFFRILPDSIPK